ncbi:MAG: MoaD/ThiS family protein [Candidatus Bathyarchaeota archaeon]|nr:MoaD/ThiS family protein [Candidatus Bathyarchaeota archaeon]MCX8178135.1 MoaD/ThiS family protein [Candidatus Bathyarchaeota archaeon]MDW8193935.1 MoaD/ThiS family protein [Nitrososphaerota archaeon]
MRIRVKFVGDLHQKVGMTDLWVHLPDGSTVENLLEDLRRNGIKVDSENSSMVIFVNGRRLEFIGGLKAGLKDLDELIIMPIIAGGI